MSDEDTESKPKNNKLLTLLLSSGGDISVKLITLALVVVSGGGNLFQTNHVGQEMKTQLDQAFRQVRELHEDFVVKRQTNDTELARAIRETHDIYNGLTDAQRNIVKRQETIIEQQEKLGKELDDLERRMEKFTKTGAF